MVSRFRKGKKRPIPETLEDYKKAIVEAQPRPPSAGIYYWIVGWHKNHRVILGSFVTEQEAYQEGYSKFQSDFKVIPLKTRDEAKASREIRAMVLDETRDVDETFKRFRHQID